MAYKYESMVRTLCRVGHMPRTHNEATHLTLHERALFGKFFSACLETLWRFKHITLDVGAWRVKLILTCKEFDLH